MAGASTSGVGPLRALQILTRIQIKSSFETLGGGSRGVMRGLGRVLTFLLYAALGVLISLCVAVMLVFADPALIPGTAVLLSGLVAVALTFQSASGSLFGFRDYDQVMSLPVPTWVVVLSRVGALYAVQVAVSAVLSCPMYVILAFMGRAGLAQVPVALVSIVFASAVPVSVVIFLSFALAVVASRFEYSNIVYLVASLAVLVLSLVASFALAGSGPSSVELDQVSRIFAGFMRVYPLAGWVSAAWAGELAYLLPFCVVSLAAVALCIAVLSHFFMGINAALSGHGAARAVDIDEASSHQTGVLKAMVVKELKCVFNTPVYAVNALGGDIFIVLITVMMLAMGKHGTFNVATSYLSMDAGMSAATESLSEIILPWVFAFCASAGTSAAASVSMEGSSNWVMATAPVPRRTVVASKVLASVVHVVPLLAVGAAVVVATGALSPLGALVALALGVAAQFFASCLGVMVDMRDPRFDWVKPNDAVKKGRGSMAVGLAAILIVFGGGAAAIELCLQMGEAVAFAFTFGVALVLALGAWFCFSRASRVPQL